MKSKITVKHFLNKRVKPSVNNGIEYYPIYCEVTYKGQNTQFNFEWDYHLKEKDSGYFKNRFTEDHLEKINSKYSKTIFAIEEEIKAIVLFEESKDNSKFSLKGFKDKYYFYTGCFSCSMQDEISEAIFEELEKHVGRNDYYDIEEEAIFFGLLKLLKFIQKKYVPDFDKHLNQDTWVNIHTYYLLNSFKALNRDARHYGFWIYKNGANLFEKYLEDNKHLKKSNPFLKKLKKLHLKEPYIYVDSIRKRINIELIDRGLSNITSTKT